MKFILIYLLSKFGRRIEKEKRNMAEKDRSTGLFSNDNDRQTDKQRLSFYLSFCPTENRLFSLQLVLTSALSKSQNLRSRFCRRSGRPYIHWDWQLLAHLGKSLDRSQVFICHSSASSFRFYVVFQSFGL